MRGRTVLHQGSQLPSLHKYGMCLQIPLFPLGEGVTDVAAADPKSDLLRPLTAAQRETDTPPVEEPFA